MRHLHLRSTETLHQGRVELIPEMNNQLLLLTELKLKRLETSSPED
jgi:hypothetical protein